MTLEKVCILLVHVLVRGSAGSSPRSGLSLRLASSPERHQCSILVGSLGFGGSIMVHSCHLTWWIFLACCRNVAWPDSQWLWYAQQSVAAIIDHKAPFIVWSIVSLQGYTMVSMRHRSSGWCEKESFDLHPGGLGKPFKHCRAPTALKWLHVVAFLVVFLYIRRLTELTEQCNILACVCERSQPCTQTWNKSACWD